LPRGELHAVGPYSAGNTGTTGSRDRSLMLTMAVVRGRGRTLIEGPSHGTLYLGLLTDSVDIRGGGSVDNTDSGNGSGPLFK
jgi:pilus assembly protein CpaB